MNSMCSYVKGKRSILVLVHRPIISENLPLDPSWVSLGIASLWKVEDSSLTNIITLSLISLCCPEAHFTAQKLTMIISNSFSERVGTFLAISLGFCC